MVAVAAAVLVVTVLVVARAGAGRGSHDVDAVLGCTPAHVVFAGESEAWTEWGAHDAVSVAVLVAVSVARVALAKRVSVAVQVARKLVEVGVDRFIQWSGLVGTLATSGDVRGGRSAIDWLVGSLWASGGVRGGGSAFDLHDS